MLSDLKVLTKHNVCWGEFGVTGARNVLFVMVDELQARVLTGPDRPAVATPNLDRLAARGTVFRNAYTPSPICVPARAAVATGRYPHQLGYWDNAHAYDGRAPSWGHVLQRAGVPATSIGKLHYRRDDDPIGFENRILPMHIVDGIGQIWGSVRNPLPKQRRAVGMLGAIGPGVSKYNEYDMRVAAAAEAWLSAREPAEPGEATAPWAAFVSFVAPHFPLTAPPEYMARYPADAMALPPARPEAGHPVHPWVARMNDIEDSDAELGDDARRREAIAAYYALCTFVDAQVGRALDALEAAGLADETLVIFTSDHGETLGMRGRWGKSVLYREATQVPLILAGPGVAAGAVVDTPASLLDIPPTITDAAGAPPDPNWVGKSLLKIASAPTDPERIVFSEYHAANSPTGGFMVANARWKHHHYVGYPPELFDLDADPFETRNLADHPDHAETLAQMRRALLAVCDPDVVDAAAKADQDRLVARFGGPDRAFAMGPAGATPVPKA